MEIVATVAKNPAGLLFPSTVLAWGFQNEKHFFKINSCFTR